MTPITKAVCERVPLCGVDATAAFARSAGPARRHEASSCPTSGGERVSPGVVITEEARVSPGKEASAEPRASPAQTQRETLSARHPSKAMRSRAHPIELKRV